MIYSFKCQCGNTIDIEQSIHAEIVEPVCTDCHQSMSRSWSSPAITFKGTGFYTTDYKH
jgi:predicted nucleic acid-binding Zn ribbon protein